MTHDEAVDMARKVVTETRLPVEIVDEADGEFRVDIDLPLREDEIRVTASLNATDDWKWVYPRHVAPRLRNSIRVRRLFRRLTARSSR